MKEVVGCYKIHLDKKINEGSQAQLYECTNTDSNTSCCARIINKRNQYGQQNQQQYDKELQVLEQLKWIRHDNILTIHDYKEEENYIYQFCELCDETLVDFIKGKQISRFGLLQFIQQISSGYLRLKNFNIIHRDLKPENILIKKKLNQLQYKIADFGISKVIDDPQRLNTSMVGTQQYSSPEMLQSRNYSYESDIFSFGLILFESTTGSLDLFNNLKKQKKFFETLKGQSFKEYLKNNLTDKIEEQTLDILDKLIVYDPSKRMTWEELNLLATQQLKELSFKSQSNFRERGGASFFQNNYQADFQQQFQLTENQNFQNLSNSQVKMQNYQCNQQFYRKFSVFPIECNQQQDRNQFNQQFGIQVKQQFEQCNFNKKGQNFGVNDFNRKNQDKIFQENNKQNQNNFPYQNFNAQQKSQNRH